MTGALVSYSEKNGYSALQNLVSTRPIIGYMEIFEDMEFYLNKPTEIYVHGNGQSLGVVPVILLEHKDDFKDGLSIWRVLVPWDVS